MKYVLEKEEFDKLISEAKSSGVNKGFDLCISHLLKLNRTGTVDYLGNAHWIDSYGLVELREIILKNRKSL